MTITAISSQSKLNDYGVFWQQWPEYEQTHGERRLVGLEVELIGSHISSENHIDPRCPMCHQVRLALLEIASLMVQELSGSKDSLMCSVNSHSNSALCLPALGNRSAVWVSITVHWRNATHVAFETDLLRRLNSFLGTHGSRQR